MFLILSEMFYLYDVIYRIILFKLQQIAAAKLYLHHSFQNMIPQMKRTNITA